MFKPVSIFLILFVLLVKQASGQGAPVTVVPVDSIEELNDTSQSVREIPVSELAMLDRTDSLINYAYTFLGKKYRRGGTGGKGFDCSGYTLTVFKRFHIKLPHTAAGQCLMGVQINKKNLKKGDLLFFRGRNRRSSRVGHVGIVISEKGSPVRFIHSSSSEGVRIDRLEFDYYKKRFLKAVRIPELYR